MSGLSYAERFAKSSAPQRPNPRAVGSNRNRVAQRPPQRRAPQPQMRPPQAMGRPMPKPQPKAWNPEQMLDKSCCEIFCKVRKVHSGDQLRLQYAYPDRSGMSIDFLLMLDYVSAPRVSRKPDDSQEEAFGFEAREYLRKYLNGAVVRCVWNPQRGQIKKRNGDSLRKALEELKPQAERGDGDMRAARVYGELKCLRDNPKQRYSEQVYRDPNNWIDVGTLMCSQGWARTKNIRDEKEQHNAWLSARAAEKLAMDNFRGQFQKINGSIARHTRILDWSPNVEDLFEQYKNKPIKGIVEEVREGSTVKCEIYVPGDGSEIKSQMLMICLSGIQSERMPKPLRTQKMEYEQQVKKGLAKGGFKATLATQLAKDAKINVERRLLHQDVTITLHNFSQQEDKVWGTITLGQKDVASFLLRQGLAWTVNYSMAPANRERYMADEARAQHEKKGRWATKEPPAKRKTRSPGQGEWGVTQIYNADCIQLTRRNPTGNPGKDTKRVYLAHIKAPRENRNSPMESDPYAWEAKEFVRKALIGKPIRVETIYEKQFEKRKGETKMPPLTSFVTITYPDKDGSSKDISLQLVKAGLAKLIRSNEMDRAPNFFGLTKAQEEAMKQKLNWFGDEGKYKAPTRIDLTLPRIKDDNRRKKEQQRIRVASRDIMRRLGLGENIDTDQRRPFQENEKARKTSGPRPAVVEYVFGATRMKVRIEIKGTMYLIILHLGGIRGYRGQDLNEEQSRIQSAADEWVKKEVQQQDNVFVDIESLDRNSNFVGHILIGQGRNSKNLSFKLLDEGWVEVFANAARRSRFCDQLYKHENVAKEAGIGRWHGVNLEEEKQLAENKGDPSKAPVKPTGPQKHRLEGSKLTATVTYVESATELFVVLTGKDFEKDYNEVTDYMKTVNPIKNEVQEKEFRAGDLVAGLFQNAYYRCRISSIRKDRIHNVKFIDFGNRGQLREEEIIPLERRENGVVNGRRMKEIPALAKRCRLAGLKPPPAKAADYCYNAGNFFHSRAYGDVEIEVLQVRRERKFEVYEIEVYKDGVNLNELLVQEGWCRVDENNYFIWGGGRDKREDKFPARHKKLQELSADAISNHRGMYQYGTVDSDDED